jgi:DNA-binding GntR family transcriptional regulator
MTGAHKAATTPQMQRVVQWLVENRTEFEGQGIGENKLAAALGMSSTEVTEVVDHLEAREEVVRMPQAGTTPPHFLLKPGRGWVEVRDEILVKESGT